MAVGQLLGQGAAPRVAEDVDALPPERLQQPGGQVGQARHADRVADRARPARPRGVEGDELEASEMGRYRRPHVEIGADAGEEQQGRALPLDADPDRVGGQVDELQPARGRRPERGVRPSPPPDEPDPRHRSSWARPVDPNRVVGASPGGRGGTARRGADTGA